MGSRIKMIKNFWNFHNPLINIEGKSRKNFKKIDNAVFEKIIVIIVLLYMGSYGRKLKSINLPSIFLLKMINSLEAQLQYELLIFLNILKQKNLPASRAHSHCALRAQVWVRLGRAIRSSRFALRSFWTSRFALSLVLFAYV